MLNCIILLVPPAVSLFSVWHGPAWLGGLTFLCILAAVALASCCRECESAWIFVLTVVSAVPVNIGVIYGLADAMTEYPHPVLQFLTINLYGNIVILSLEETILAVIGRLIWRRQARLKQMIRCFRNAASSDDPTRPADS